MKKIITPLAAFISLVFIPFNWLHLNPKSSVSGLSLMTYAGKGVISENIVAALGIIGLLLIPLSLILKNKARTFVILGLSIIAIILLLVFASVGGDRENITYPTSTLASGWYGSLISFIVALIGAFISSQPAKNDTGLSLNAES